ncbi:MAG: hypothetical protein JNL11_15405 [Bdellovibrionaceae bacterium]|nr:hypothetical protein [Pseudobdellovibrionaceae bacterium]
MKVIFERVFNLRLIFLTVIPAAWLFFFLGQWKDIFGLAYSPDSFAYLLLGSNIWDGNGFVSPSIRDFNMPLSGEFLEPSRSFPPLMPILVGFVNKVFETGIASGLFLNMAILSGIFFIYNLYLYKKMNFLGFALSVILPVFALRSGPFADEVLAGRAIPLVLFFLFLILYWLSEDELSPSSAIKIGVAMGLAYLTRFDAIIFCFLFLIWLKFQVKTKVWCYTLLTFLVTISPWLIRNIMQFGTPLASDNSITAMSIYPGPGSISIFADKIPMISDDVGLWITQRMSYVLENIKVLWRVLAEVCGIFAPLVFVFFFVSFFKREGTENLRPLTLLWVLGNFMGTSLTPYHDARYFSISACLLLLTATSCIFHIVIRASHHKVGHGQAIRFSSLVVLAIMPLLIMLGVAFSSYRSSISRDDRQAVYIRKIVEQFKNFVPDRALVAATLAEHVAYYSTWKTIYLPVNAENMTEHFMKYVQKFRIEYLILPEKSNLVESLKLPILARWNGIVLVKTSE